MSSRYTVSRVLDLSQKILRVHTVCGGLPNGFQMITPAGAPDPSSPRLFEIQIEYFDSAELDSEQRIELEPAESEDSETRTPLSSYLQMPNGALGVKLAYLNAIVIVVKHGDSYVLLRTELPVEDQPSAEAGNTVGSVVSELMREALTPPQGTFFASNFTVFAAQLSVLESYLVSSRDKLFDISNCYFAVLSSTVILP